MKIDELIVISVELFQYGYIVKLNVDVYSDLSSSAFFSICEDKDVCGRLLVVFWSSVVVCGRLLVIFVRLWWFLVICGRYLF